MKEKIGKEPQGVPQQLAAVKTPCVKDETIRELKRLLDEEKSKQKNLKSA